MRLEILRTAKPELAGGSHFVLDNDAPGVQIYNPLFVGSLVECAEYVERREGKTPSGIRLDRAMVKEISDLLDVAQSEISPQLADRANGVRVYLNGLLGLFGRVL